MKRDMDLVRAILLAMEACPNGLVLGEFSLPGYSYEQVHFHAYLMWRAGLIEAENITTVGHTSPLALPRSITWQGYDFLSNARSPDMWQQAKALVEKVGSASFDIWVAILTEVVKRNLGI